MTTNGGANSFAAGCYSADYLVFGNPNATNDRSCVQGSGVIPRSIPDGTSNTVFFGEIYASCGSSAAASLWADSPPPAARRRVAAGTFSPAASGGAPEGSRAVPRLGR
jgi:hypothetical protein